MSSFKVPCPSCENAVLIKNPNLVGTKIECPKCKYRFKVEEPSGEADAGKGGKVKKAGDGKKSKSKALGIGLGVAAVLLLAVGGYMLFGGSGDKPSSTGSIGNTGSGNVGGGGGGTGEPDPDAPKPKPKPKSGLPFSDKDVTNLLPGQSVAVYRFNLERMRLSPFFTAMFDQAMTDLFRTSMGFSPELVETYIHCVVGEARDPFGVIRLTEPMAPKDITAKMAGLAETKSVKGRTYNVVKSNPFLTAVSHTLSAQSLLGDFYEKLPPRPTDAGQEKPLAVAVYDNQTILVGELAVLTRFLGEIKADGYPEFKTDLIQVKPKPPTPADPMAPGAAPGGAPAGTGAQPLPGAPATAGTGTQPLPGAPGTTEGATPQPPKAPETPAGPPKDFTTNPSYRTIDAALKETLNTLEEDSANPPMVAVAEKFNAAIYDPKLLRKPYQPLAEVAEPVMAKTKYLGVNLTTLTTKKLVAKILLVTESKDIAYRLALDTISPGLNKAIPLVSFFLMLPVQFRDYTAPGSVFAGGGGFPSGFPGGGLPGEGGPGGSDAVGPGGPGGGGARPPFRGGSGSPDSGFGGGPGGPGGGTGRPFPGSFPGSAGAMPGGVPGGIPGVPGGIPGVPGQGFPGQGFPGAPGVDPSHIPTDSHVDLRLIDEALSFIIEVSWTDDIYRRILAPRLVGIVNQLKGRMAVFAGEQTGHALAAAVQGYVRKHNQFPRGTADWKPTSAERMGLPHPPAQRLSFYAELLPFLGHGRVAAGLDNQKAWYHDDNVTSAEAWLPELLAPDFPQAAWRASSPFAAAHTFGGTNYVAVAGIGSDAARYNPNDPAAAKLVGITGYDWGSKVEEVKDGLANTIYLIQVAPGVPRPWAAGGGATVMGLDPKNPLAGFAHKRADGQMGTTAIMGDGTVRWIPADINPQLLLAMTTRAGGEQLPNLDTIAPRVELPVKEEPKTTPLPAPTPPKTGDTKAGDAINLETAPPPKQK